MKKQALGRGLSALIPEAAPVEEYEKIDVLELDDIYPNPDQPRKTFDEVALNNLMDSISENGVIQPIIVTKTSKGYQIVAGERRWRASKLLKVKTIPAIIRDYDELNKAKIALLENVQREGLNPVEEAMGYRTLMEFYSINQTDLAKTIGKSRSYIANLIRILQLEERILEYIKDGVITFGHAKALLMIDEEDRMKVTEHIIDKGLSVRQVEKLAENPQKPKVKEQIKTQDLFSKNYQEKITDKIGLKTEIHNGAKKSKLVIHFKTEEELSKLLELLHVEM